MKALVISESQDVLASYADFFKSMGYENLCYRWLLKAMDNLEEIQPELIFINASDYPRHWKTLVQHVRAAGLGNPVILLAAERLNDDEQEKARFLGIYCITSPINDEKTRSLIRQQLGFDQAEEVQAAEIPAAEAAIEVDVQPDFEAAEAKVEIEIIDIAEPSETDTVVHEETVSIEVEEIKVEPESAADEATSLPAMNTEEPESGHEEKAARAAEIENELETLTEYRNEPKPQTPSSEAERFTFIHPSTKTPICGNLLEYTPPLLFFRPDDENLFRSLRFGQKSEGVIKRTEETLPVFVQIQGLDEGVAEVCILK